MSQCKAIWYKRPGIAAGFYCTREQGHKGDHETCESEKFTDAQAKYHKTNRLTREQLERELAALRLLEGMEAIEVSTLGTFLKGGDIPETINAAHGTTVRRMLTAERAGGALADAVSRYIDDGCNDAAGLRTALSAWVGPPSFTFHRGGHSDG